MVASSAYNRRLRVHSRKSCSQHALQAKLIEKVFGGYMVNRDWGKKPRNGELQHRHTPANAGMLFSGAVATV